ncbi:hypothetical protein [Caballeronia glebae]|uniref:hypothetical protein n=1 Tax=Caballeronia glebae TaxID=1777143 RepID=UPI0038B83C81
MQAIRHEGIFKSAHEAVVFACNYASQQYAMSPMAKILQRRAGGSGRGLIGLDGAAQSGMVLAELQKMDKAQILAMVARSTPQRERCDCLHACCSGWRVSSMYRDAISELADIVVPVVGTEEVSNRRLRVAIIAKFFGDKTVVIKEVAHSLEITLRTAERQTSVINKYLKEQEKTGWTEFYARLDEIGMLLEVA